MLMSPVLRSLVSFCGLMFFAFLAGGSFIGNTVNLSMINTAKEKLGTSLEATQSKSEETKEEIEDAYTQMKKYLADKNLSDANIQRMETRLDSMNAKHRALVKTVTECKDNGNKLFSLLDSRASENKTENLKKALKEKIRSKRSVFSTHVTNAEEVCDKVATSIQKYNDLVGYFQVNKGLDGVDRIIEEINGAIEAGNALNDQINTFVKSGMDIIKDF